MSVHGYVTQTRDPKSDTKVVITITFLRSLLKPSAVYFERNLFLLSVCSGFLDRVTYPWCRYASVWWEVMSDTKYDVSALVCVRLLLFFGQQAAARLAGKWCGWLSVEDEEEEKEEESILKRARCVYCNEPGPFRCRVEAVVVVGGGGEGGRRGEEKKGTGMGGRGGGLHLVLIKAWKRSKKHARSKRHLHIIPQVSGGYCAASLVTLPSPSILQPGRPHAWAFMDPRRPATIKCSVQFGRPHVWKCTNQAREFQ